ncbi:SIR2 family protein [Nocardia sp. CA-135398]|uniref:SIR2 family protein n=1 Tax=Nocardia sp. CA-135398 TaxID=3239977 RepID=UPI003D98DA49
MEPERLSALKRAAINGRYNLFLGAGASLDSKSASGESLPRAGVLAEEIAATFSVPIEDGDALWRVYARVVEANRQPEMYKWLRSKFYQVSPPEWMRFLALSPWETVWTLNLDDSFENSYAQVSTEYSRTLRSISWDDQYSGIRGLAVVHLHGHVFDEKPRPLVFSLGEYADAAVARAAWPITFRDVYGTAPMVIIGARMRDEPDIEAIVSRRQPAHDAPNIYVNREISSAMASDLQAWGILPVEMTAEDFAIAWADLIDIDIDSGPVRSEELALRLGRQFAELRTDSGLSIPKGHDLVGGDEPVWGEIVTDRFAEIDWIREGYALARRVGAAGSTNVAIVFTGARLAGSSTGLLAISRILRNEAWRVFQYVSDERPDLEAILGFAADGKPLALIFDGVSDQADDVAELLRRARSAALQIAVVAVDRKENDARISGKIPDELLMDRKIRSINRRLTKTDATRLVDKLSELGRLGTLESKPDRQRLVHFRGRDLFAAMAEVEDAPGFGRRIGHLIAELKDQQDIALVFLAAYASRVDRNLTVSDAALMLNSRTEEVVRRVQGVDLLSAVLSTDGSHVKTRHRWMALAPVVARMSEPVALRTLGDSIVRLRPRLGLVSNRSRTSTSLLAGSFMIWRNLTEAFPSADLDRWYETLRPTFDWSARYWEQRAIMSRHEGSAEYLARAESYARRAVSLRPDSYSYTTLGTVLAARAAAGPEDTIASYYEKMGEAFGTATVLEPNNPVTWLARLRHTLPIVQRMREIGTIEGIRRSEIEDEWLSMYSSAMAFGRSNQGIEDDLTRIRAQFDSIIRRGRNGPNSAH